MTDPNAPLNLAMTVEQLWQPVPGGSGTYIRALAAEFGRRKDVSALGIRARHERNSPDIALPIDVTASRLPRRLLYESWTRVRKPAVPRRPQQRSGSFDVIHATTWAVPPATSPLVVTVHDVAFLRSPEHFTPRGITFFHRALDITRDEADLVIVPSEITRADCIDAGIESDRIRVIHHGTTRHATTEQDVADFRARHGLVRDFVLWCGTFEPRKNLSALLEAFDAMANSGTDLDLVLVGPAGWGDTSEEIRRRATALPAGRVHNLGRLPEHDLQLAYAAARVFCFPSLWEGFGMPVLEAMNHGTPVVTSRGTSMAEISGDGALLVDPLVPDEIAEAVLIAAGPEHARLSAAATANAATYTWEASADKHLAAYHEAIAARRPVRGTP